MKTICEHSLCTGCGLCLVKCPKNCITMTEKGNLGHVYPQIDQSQCINCGKCKSVCPSVNTKQFQQPSIVYAAWSKDEMEYKTSASGGIASVLSKYVIASGGVVYGCVMLPDIVIKHMRVDNFSDLQQLKGSKYVQSTIVEVLPLLEQDVKKGLLTLFIGTPCQVAAVKSLFKSIPKHLLLVDLVCHGVPSQRFLKKCVAKTIKSTHCDKITFRDGNDFCTTIYHQGEIIYKKHLFKSRYKELYLNTFFDGFTYRPSCYSCSYASPKRISDITIGDFWGLGKEDSCDNMLSHVNGCSLILPCTSKGMDYVQKIKDQINLYERKVSEAVNGNDQLRHPIKKSGRIRIFRYMMKLFDFPQIYYIFMIDRIFNIIIKHLKWKYLR